MKNEFDLLCDIILHVSEVKENLEDVCNAIKKRGIAHDRTKFQELEFDAFVSTRDKFKKATYGSKEYQECIDMIKPAIEHHYKNNNHHIKYYKNGINDMSLIDILELLADWKAASRRGQNAKTFKDSINFSLEKHNIQFPLKEIILNTAKSLNWI